MRGDQYSGALTVAQPRHIVRTLRKGRETFAFVYTIDSRADVLRTIARWASDPDIDFDWRDAAWISAGL